MSTHRYRLVIGVAGIVFGAMVVGLGPTGVHAQAPPRADDAAAEGLRSLYVPGGLSPDQAVKQVVATSPDLKRTKALLDEAKGGAMQAMAGLVPQLELLGRYTRLSPVDSSGTYDIPGIGPITLDFPSLTEQTATDAILTYSFTRSLAEAMPAYRAARKSKTAAQYQIQAELNAADGTP